MPNSGKKLVVINKVHITEREFTQREEEILAALDAIYQSCFPVEGYNIKIERRGNAFIVV